MAKHKTTTRTFRFSEEIETWGKRAAKKQHVSVNKFFVGLIRQSFDQRHDKNQTTETGA